MAGDFAARMSVIPVVPRLLMRLHQQHSQALRSPEGNLEHTGGLPDEEPRDKVNGNSSRAEMIAPTTAILSLFSLCALEATPPDNSSSHATTVFTLPSG